MSLDVRHVVGPSLDSVEAKSLLPTVAGAVRVTLCRVCVGDVHQSVGFEVVVPQPAEQDQCGEVVLQSVGVIAEAMRDESQRVEHRGFTVGVLVSPEQAKRLGAGLQSVM